jgi:hypothetical protein
MHLAHVCMPLISYHLPACAHVPRACHMIHRACCLTSHCLSALPHTVCLSCRLRTHMPQGLLSNQSPAAMWPLPMYYTPDLTLCLPTSVHKLLPQALLPYLSHTSFQLISHSHTVCHVFASGPRVCVHAPCLILLAMCWSHARHRACWLTCLLPLREQWWCCTRAPTTRLEWTPHLTSGGGWWCWS